MESYPSPNLSSQITTEEKKHEKVVLKDKELIKSKIVQQGDLVPIDLKTMLTTPIRPEDVVQAGIGNCYFLVALASILEKNPTYLDNILKIKKYGMVDLVEVTLHDVRNPNQVYTYVIEPTKVINKDGSNKHTHDAIFLLEKAYALHRIRTEPLKYSDREKVVRDVLIQANHDKDTALRILEVIAEEKALEREKELAQKLATLSGFPLSTELTLEEQKLLQKLKDKNFDIEKILNEEREKIREEYNPEYLKLEIYRVSQRMKKERLDYNSALTQGFTADSYKALLGTNSTDHLIQTDDTFHYLLMNFFDTIKKLPIEDFDAKTLQTLTTMFGDPNSEEALYFIRSIKSTNLYLPEGQSNSSDKGKVEIDAEDVDVTEDKEKTKISKDKEKTKPSKQILQPISETQALTWPDLYLQMYDSAHPNKPKKHEMLRNFLDQINWKQEDNKALHDSTLEKVKSFIQQDVPHKRGTKEYTHHQEELYQLIHKNLREDQLMSLESRSHISRDRGQSTQQNQVKGLYTEHGYQIVNCYEREGVKYIQIRNPHGKDVRDYEYKDTAEGKTLTAQRKPQLAGTNPFKAIAKNFGILSARPSDKPIKNPAIPITPNKQFDTNGYFEIELNDLTKAFGKITITTLDSNEKNVLRKRQKS